MTTDKFFDNDRGFTLLEVLLSVTILSIVIISFLAFFNQAYSYTKQNEDKTVFINVARNVLYYMEQQDYTAMNAYLGNDSTKEITFDDCTKLTLRAGNCEDFFGSKANIVNSTDVTTTVQLNKHDDLPSQLISVTVFVKWNDNKREASVKGVIKK